MPDAWSDVVDPYFRFAAKGGWVDAVVSMLAREEEAPFHGPYTAHGRLTARYVPTGSSSAGPTTGPVASAGVVPMLWGTLDSPIGFYFGGKIDLSIERRLDGVTSTTVTTYDGYSQKAEGWTMLGPDEY